MLKRYSTSIIFLTVLKIRHTHPYQLPCRRRVVFAFTRCFVYLLTPKIQRLHNMGKLPKLPKDSPKTKSVDTPSFKPIVPPIKLQPIQSTKPVSIHNVEMPSSSEDVSATSLNPDQKNVVKKSVQKMFCKNNFGKPSPFVNSSGSINSLAKATDNLSKLMEMAAAKRKLQKKESKK